MALPAQPNCAAGGSDRTGAHHEQAQRSARTPRKPEQFESGRARIEAARKTAQETAALRELAAQLPEATEVAPAAAGVIEGVRVLWQSPGRAARDETAFRYALATAHRLKARGQRLTDAALIDAYEQGYNVAQSVGADDRQPAIPAMRDRLTMARRIRGYVTHAASTSTGGSVRMSSAGRKALSTLGARGGEASSAALDRPDPSRLPGGRQEASGGRERAAADQRARHTPRHRSMVSSELQRHGHMAHSPGGHRRVRSQSLHHPPSAQGSQRQAPHRPTVEVCPKGCHAVSGIRFPLAFTASPSPSDNLLRLGLVMVTTGRKPAETAPKAPRSGEGR